MNNTFDDVHINLDDLYDAVREIQHKVAKAQTAEQIREAYIDTEQLRIRLNRLVNIMAILDATILFARKRMVEYGAIEADD